MDGFSGGVCVGGGQGDSDPLWNFQNVNVISYFLR